MKLFKQIVKAASVLALILAGAVAATAFATTLKFVETPAVTLYTAESTTATTMVVTPTPEDLDGNVLTISSFGSNPTVTVDPGILGSEEIESFTGIVNNGNNTATLTGLSRDLNSQYPYAAGTVGFTHGAGATVVFSNNPQLYNRLAALENSESITGLWTYLTSPIVPTPTTSTQAANKAYVDSVAISGAPNSSETVNGIAQLATGAQAALGTSAGSTGSRLILPASLATSTCQIVQNSVLIASTTTGKLDKGCFDQTASYTLTGNTTLASSTIYTLNVGTINATSSLTFQGNSLQKFGGSGADGALSISSGTTTLNLGGKSIFIKNYTSISITGTGALAFSNPNAGGTLIILKSQGNATISASDAIDASGMGSAVGTNANVFFGGFSTSTGAAGGGTSCSATCTAAGGGGGGNNAATTTAILDNLNLRQIFLADGSAGGNADTGGLAGRGGGALLFEIGGSWNFTGSISVAGIAGTNGASNVTGAGGGAGGSLLALYNTLVSNSGTYVITGGIGGSSNGGSIAGGTPGNSSSVFGNGFGGTGGAGNGGSGTERSGGGGGGQYFQTQNGSNGNVGVSNTPGAGGGGASGIATSSLNYFFQ